MSALLIQSGPVDLGRGYSVAFQLIGTRMDAVWSRGLPSGRRGRELLPAYRKARDAFLKQAAASLGQGVVCVEMTPGGEA